MTLPTGFAAVVLEVVDDEVFEDEELLAAEVTVDEEPGVDVPEGVPEQDANANPTMASPAADRARIS